MNSFHVAPLPSRADDPPRGRRWPAAWAMASAALIAAAHAEDKPPEATPYRPTVSSPAELSCPGWLELELGALHTSGHQTDRRTSVPYLLKYALDEDHGVLLGGDAVVRTAPEGQTALVGAGDTTVTYKTRFATGHAEDAFGLETTATLPTARRGTGHTGLGLTLNGIYSADFESAWHIDINAALQRQHDDDTGRQRIQGAWAVAVSDALTERLGIAGEISGSPSQSQLLGAVSYRLHPRLVLDAGTAVGLTQSSPRWSLFTGLTVLLGPLF